MHPVRFAALALAALPCIAAAEPIAMTADRWDTGGEVAFVEKDGRAAIRVGGGDETGQKLKGGEADLKGSDFATGTIEVDLLASGARDFVGLIFRADAEGNGEMFYLRPHMNNMPDSTQYTPVHHGNLAWQIFAGDGFESQVRFDYGKWMHVRADIYAHSARISVDGRTVLVIPHLKSANTHGTLGLTAANGAHFANFTVTPIADYRDPAPPVAEPPLAPGSVAAWQVSPAMPEAEATAHAARADWAGIAWTRLPVETNGIANLSRAGPDAGDKHSFVARFTARSAAARTVPMQFGFSDQVHVYLNGQLLYAGADLQGSRDYRFLGIVGLWDTLFLPLRAGTNDVVFVVTDNTNGGTAAAAKFDPADAVTLE
jgi:hypothetical protein